MRRLLMVTTVPETITSFLLPFAAHFRAQGWRVDALCRSDPARWNGNESTFDHVWEVEWSRNPLDPRNLQQAPQRVRKVVAEGQYDLVHVHTPVASFVTRFALQDWRQRVGRPVVVYTAHGFHFHSKGNPLFNAVFLGLEKLAGQWTDYLIVYNTEDLAAAQHYHLVSAEHIRYMPGIGVDLQLYSDNEQTHAAVDGLYQELQVPRTTRFLLVVAEFIPRKRHKDVLQAFADIQQPDAHLLLAGDGPLQDDMRQLTAALEIADRVHFLGVRRDVPVLLQAAEGLILTSQQEGLPRSILEALSMGKPVIGSRIRGNTDLLEPVGGILVDVGNIHQIEDAMNWLLKHPAEARKLGERGRAQAAKYDVQHIIHLHEELYTEALV
jgi:glycosyltransferase involved in cell wall biosynthesis